MIAWALAITTGLTSLTLALSGIAAILPFAITGFKALGTALVFLTTTPWGIAIAAIAALTVGIVGWAAANYDARSAAQKYSDALSKQNEITDESIKKIQQETAELRNKRNELEKERQELEKRKDKPQEEIAAIRTKIDESANEKQIAFMREQIDLQLKSGKLDDAKRQSLTDQVALYDVMISQSEALEQSKKQERIENETAAQEEFARLQKHVEQQRSRLAVVQESLKRDREQLKLLDDQTGYFSRTVHAYNLKKDLQESITSAAKEELKLAKEIRR